MAQMTIPGGKERGATLEQATTGCLEWWANKLETSVADGTARRPDLDAPLAAAMRAELARRSGGGSGGSGAPAQVEAPRPAPRPAAPLARREEGADLVRPGSYADGDRLTAALSNASARYHLVSPATSAGTLPEGTEVALTVVSVDAEKETYDVGGGKRGLAKSALDRVGAAAGISWDPDRCRRLDDGSDPRYVAFQAIGRVRHFDGTEIVLSATKEMDLRDGSAQVQALRDRYERALEKWRAQGSRAATGYGALKYEPKDPTAQISEMRLHILAHAESKAKLRAIRSLGLRASYDKDELDKPFAVARLMFTGRSTDPELKREFARMQAQAMLGASAALYGAPAPALPAPRHHAPPPVGSQQWDDEPTPLPRPAPAAQLTQRVPPPPPSPRPAAAPPPSDPGDAWEPDMADLAEVPT